VALLHRERFERSNGPRSARCRAAQPTPSRARAERGAFAANRFEPISPRLADELLALAEAQPGGRGEPRYGQITLYPRRGSAAPGSGRATADAACACA